MIAVHEPDQRNDPEDHQNEQMNETQGTDDKAAYDRELHYDNDLDNNGDNNQDKCSNDKVGLFIFASLYTFLFGGGFYGWGPMQLLLEENGSYSWKCNYNDYNNTMTSTDDMACSEQTKSLLNINFVATLTILTAPFIGYILDKYHPVMVMILLLITLMIAFTTLGITVAYTSSNVDPILYVSFICLGIVAQTTSILEVETAIILYPTNYINRARVITIFAGLFDSGSVTYLILWALGNQGLSLTVITVIYAILAMITFGGGLYYWILLTMKRNDIHIDDGKFIKEDIDEIVIEDCDDRKQSIVKSRRKSRIRSSIQSFSSEFMNHMIINDLKHQPRADSVITFEQQFDASLQFFSSEFMKRMSINGLNQQQIPEHPDQPISTEENVIEFEIEEGKFNEQVIDANNEREECPIVSTSNDDENNKNAVIKVDSEAHTAISDGDRNSLKSSSTCSNQVIPYVNVADRPYYQQLTSEPFLLLCYFFSIHQLNNIYTLATAQDFLAYLGDDQLDNKYLTVFTFLLPVSVVSIPCVDYILRHYGHYVGFQIINVLAVAYSCVKLFGTNLNIQIIGFIIFSFYRFLLFSITLSYVPILINVMISGKAIGIMFFMSGVIAFLNFPLSNLAITTNDGNFYQSNLILMIITIPCFLVAYRLNMYIQREEKQRTCGSHE